MKTNKVKRQPVPDGVKLPPHLAYCGTGSEELSNSDAGKAEAFLGSRHEDSWSYGCRPFTKEVPA
jgi:hypothetical protein